MARLKFYARGTALVTDPHAQERGIRRFVARRWQEVATGRWAWCPTEKPQETDAHPDLIRAARDGDLWPADEATAKACGLGFDPTFGGERTQTIKEFKSEKASEPAGEKPSAEPKAGKQTGGKGES